MMTAAARHAYPRHYAYVKVSEGCGQLVQLLRNIKIARPSQVPDDGLRLKRGEKISASGA